MSSKSEILALGCGGCGNTQLDTLLKLDKRYSGIFFNTNMREMAELDTFDRIRRCFFIPNADGTGKDRNLAEGYLKTEAPKFADMISKFANQKYVVMLSSGNGGTGSKSVTLLPPVIKRFAPEKVISLMATMPSLNETDIDFKNAIDFWNEMIERYEKGQITNLMLVDNNKQGTEAEINQKAMNSFDDIFNIINGKLDGTDVSRILNQKGYNVVLKLNNSIPNLKDAIDKAIDDSVFFVPENLECSVLVANVNTNHFNTDEIKEMFPAYEFSKVNETTEGDTVIVLGGCEIPTAPIELIQEALKELQEKAKGRVSNNKNLKVIKVGGETNKPETSTQNQSVGIISSQDLNDIFDDDSLWD